MPLTEKEIEECLRVLEGLVENRAELLHVDLDKRNRLLTAAGRVSRPDRDEQRQLHRAARRKDKRDVREHDRAVLQRAQIRQKRLEPVFVTPEPELLLAAGGGAFAAQESPADPEPMPDLKRWRNCYVCKTRMTRVHSFYDQMCNECGDFNFAKRSQTADLRGRVALISGARVKIGYQAAILLLRAGARVIVTTRFPRDAAQRYAREKDYESWGDRLQVYGLDLRHTPSVEAFAKHLSETENQLDFVLHNACQTVRRPTGFYQHLMDAELLPHASLPEPARRLLVGYEDLRAHTARALTEGAGTGPLFPVGLHAAPVLSQVPLAEEDRLAGQQLFPAGQLDADLQQVDLRDVNSWRLPLDQVGTVELLEVQLVNAIAPFVLNARLKPLMLRSRTFDKHIVNVSAMEGQFYRRFKTDKHPHTNMAKAALNMMTRTSAVDYANDGIFMNSVDTGWVTDEDPHHIALRKTEECGFHPPLDIVDGAARIVDPILDGINTGKHVWGQFLKDYRPTAW
ncbi:MAG: oxidoreductase [Polyangiaceae bacterium]|jgi:NAD(P)-dependent dehydrogenase (short-subunit alcohol dehydrogenase family)|nr:oxidoreductase [Polyangiaceae bacterium]